MGRFGPDGFAFFETTRSDPSAAIRTLCGTRERRCISIRETRSLKRASCAKLRQFEFAAQFPVDARQQIQIERRRHAQRIVVGLASALRRGFTRSAPSSSESPGFILCRILRKKSAPRRAKSCRWCCPGTTSGAARLAPVPQRALNPFQVLCFDRFDTHAGEQISAPRVALLQRRARDIDRQVIDSCRAPCGRSLQQIARLRSAAAAQFDDDVRFPGQFDDLRRGLCSSAASARVRPYSGSSVITSNSAEPTSSYSHEEGSVFCGVPVSPSATSCAKRMTSSSAIKPILQRDLQFSTSRNPAYMYGYSGRNQFRKLGRASSRAVRGEAPFIT